MPDIQGSIYSCLITSMTYRSFSLIHFMLQLYSLIGTVRHVVENARATQGPGAPLVLDSVDIGPIMNILDKVLLYSTYLPTYLLSTYQAHHPSIYPCTCRLAYMIWAWSIQCIHTSIPHHVNILYLRMVLEHHPSSTVERPPLYHHQQQQCVIHKYIT